MTETPTLSARADVVTDRGDPGLRFSYDKRGTRFPPSAILDAPPEFALIPKEQLQVDHAYQRGLSAKRIKDTASAWSWAACGALKVALRPDGEWFVFDGQHRLAAALLRHDVKALPCLVYEMKTVREEAAGFLAQTTSKPMTVIERFKALLMVQDPVATMVKNLLDRNQITLRGGVKPGDKAIGCAAELLHWGKNDPETLKKVWPLMVQVIEHGGMVTDKLLRAFVYLEQRIENDSLTERRWRKRLGSIRPADLLDGIAKANALDGGTQARSCAAGVLAVLNRGLQRRLLVPGVNS